MFLRRLLSSCANINPTLSFLQQVKQKKYQNLTLDDKSRVLSICIYNADNDAKYNDVKKQLQDNGILATVDKYICNHKDILPDESGVFIENLPKSYNMARQFLDSQYQNESLFGKAFIVGGGFVMDRCEKEIIEYLLDSKIKELEKNQKIEKLT